MNQSNLIELNNIRVLSTTFEKLLVVVSEEQAETIRGIGIDVKTLESDEYGTSYTIVIKVVNDKFCDLYNTIKRASITKGLYDIVVQPTEWKWLEKSGTRLDAYFIRKLEQTLKVNPTLMAMINPTPVSAPVRKSKTEGRTK